MWDVTVIGGGVVGCAVMRAFTLLGAKVLLLEKGGDILSGTSKANSALLHTGFDAPIDSLERACMRDGYEEYMKIHDRMNLPLLQTGALVVAWNMEQKTQLSDIVEKAHKNGVHDVYEINASQLYQKEPNLGAGALGAVCVPGESIIDPWSAPLAYATQAVMHGAEYRFYSEVKNAHFQNGIWTLVTQDGKTYKSKLVINCAGTHGDDIESFCCHPAFKIKPRKGQFIVYDKMAAKEINAIILPVPTKITKGIVLTKTAFGNLLLGPTAEEQDDKDHAEVVHSKLEELISKGTTLLPNLKNYTITATYAGLRPATENKEYRIYCHKEKNWLTAAGIRSTGLTASLGIAKYLVKLYKENFSESMGFTPPSLIKWPKMPNLCQYRQRDYQLSGDNGGIICHCELVTKREVSNAMNSIIPPENLGGLRRRTRLMMGRCNGFYCSHEVASIIDHLFPNTLLAKRSK